MESSSQFQISDRTGNLLVTTHDLKVGTTLYSFWLDARSGLWLCQTSAGVLWDVSNHRHGL